MAIENVEMFGISGFLSSLICIPVQKKRKEKENNNKKNESAREERKVDYFMHVFVLP